MRSIAIKLWSGMMLLIVIVLVLLWLFQIVFLEKFYTRQRVKEVTNRASAVVHDVDFSSESSFEDRLDSFAYNYNCNLDLVNSVGEIIYSAGTAMQMPMMLQNTLRAGLFNDVLNGETISVPLKHPRFNSSYMLIGLPVADKGVIKGALLLNMPLAPVKDTADILKRQLVYISAILLLTALLLSFILSRMFIRPILSITRAAGQMASGNFKVRLGIKSRDEIGRLSGAINHLGEELSKTEQLRRDFIANVSHELRTPLSLIRGYAETMRDVTGHDTEKREKQLGIIIEESERLSGIVNDILDLSRIQSGSMTLNPAVFNLSAVAAAVADKYALLSEQLGIAINVHIENSISVTGDKLRIQQVLHNLLNNAFSHNRSGSSVSLKAYKSGNTARIEVSDNGEGIPEEELPYIWDRYYTSKKTINRKRVGTGLGLSIVGSILKAHGGKYGVVSTEGEGTTFWFELKQAEQ